MLNLFRKLTLALLTDLLDQCKILKIEYALRNKPEQLKFKASVFFSHYVFEAYRKINAIDLLLDRLKPWVALPDQDMKTVPEVFSNITRSDCHAWSTHPIYHYMTTILGIRPAEMGFETVEIKPQLGFLKEAEGTMFHPNGEIKVKLTKKDNCLIARVVLPININGKFIYNNQEILLNPGLQEFEIYG